jgi:hypothetical protein
MDKTVYEYEGSGVNIKVGVYGTPGIIWIGSSSYCLVSGEIRRIVQPWDRESAGLANRFELTSM